MINVNSTRARQTITLLLTLLVASGMASPVDACTTVMVGKRATEDGSVLMASSCDGDVMGLIYVMPAQTYPPGTKLPMYWNVPRPKTYQEYQANLRKGYDLVGRIPTTETYRSIILGGNLESMTTGGLNEHGLSIAIEFLPMRAGLACDKGVVGPNSNHWTTSLIANGLLRAKTAREAIRMIGAMINEFGFLYYRAPSAGVALPIADKHETWLMEIFGPGEDWTGGGERLGGVWCAQRIPDGEVGCSANRSRIGKVDLEDRDHFMASANVFSLAQDLGFWKPDEPFVWYEVYGGPGSKYNSLREWRALSLAAPSLGLKATGDPAVDRYPFSVRPDKLVAVRTLMHVMRDDYRGTAFDLTEHPANFSRVDRRQPQWNFRLVHNLANNLRYQDAIKDIRHVVEPAEGRFLNVQAEFEKAAIRVFGRHGASGAQAFLTDYARQCSTSVGYAYDELVDYLMFQYLLGYKELAPPTLPRIAAPLIPDPP